jgi:superfamily II DNA or RNA helicase
VTTRPNSMPSVATPLEKYYEKYGSRISQDSERLFVEEFLYPLLGTRLDCIEPQCVFLDRTGKSRRIDFAYHGEGVKLAIEVNGETYHAEGIIPDEQFDDNLFRQNEILRRGYQLVRFSYSQLQSQRWRPIVAETLRALFSEHAPSMLVEYALSPNPIQLEALDALTHARDIRGWDKGVVVMPTGTGKTILSALDAKRVGGRVLYLVHRLDILSQSLDAYRAVWGSLKDGLLTGVERRDEKTCDVLFASKDTLRQPAELSRFPHDWFSFVVIDEVHHGQSPSYQDILRHFRPKFMLGMTATPDRTDRKDIFELFDYNKIYEIPLHEVIDRGFLVPYTYIGLTDDIDYSAIRYQNQRYRVDDLERYLIVPERNQAILDAYLAHDKGSGDKAIGFCVSIAHADRMAEFFTSNGVKAAAVHSASPDRDDIVQRFRDDDIQVLFTVDLFNEGVDFPNVRVLLFLRPTESKTVFVQQLGRGLRRCIGKDRLRVLDFIGNYQRANQVRKYLAKGSRRDDFVDEKGRRIKRIVYEYSTGCEVVFDAQVEEILNRQDAADLGLDKQDLKDAYFALAEQLQRKPTKMDLDEKGEYASRHYVQMWGTWLKFLRDVGEYTEASYRYPQGTHLGHVLSILWYFGQPSRNGTHLDDRYIKMRGDLDAGRIGNYQRQLKYKLQATMELHVLEDDRTMPADRNEMPTLTALGRELLSVLEADLEGVALAFPIDEDGVPSSEMTESEAVYNSLIAAAASRSPEARRIIRQVFLGMPAVQQMLAYLYHVVRERRVEKNRIYSEFFSTPFVKKFCEQEGIEEATLEASKRRCPFLLNVLAACGVVTLERSHVVVNKLLLLPSLVTPYAREDRRDTLRRYKAVQASWPADTAAIESDDLSIVRELFGAAFLTSDYTWTELDMEEIE